MTPIYNEGGGSSVHPRGGEVTWIPQGNSIQQGQDIRQSFLE